MSEQVPNYQPSSIETIDGAFLDYVEGLNLFATTINGFEKVPVIWSSAERAYQIKNNREIRDKNGSLIPPIISLERTSSTKDPNKKGYFQANLSKGHDRFVYTKQLNQEKTSGFANVDSFKKKRQINFVTSKKNQKKVYEYISIRIPVYITVEYKINIITNYQSQMNEIIQPFMSRLAQNYFLIQKDGHRYECFMDQSFQQDSIANLGEEERKYKTVITVKTLGYLIGEGNNQEEPQKTIVENAVQLKLSTEAVISPTGDQQQVLPLQPVFRNVARLLKSGVLIKKIFIFGNEEDSIYTINHQFGSKDLIIRIRDNTDDSAVEAGIVYIDNNTIQVDIGEPNIVDGFTAMILG